MNEKTLEEQLEEELKDQLTDISMLHTGTPEKSKAISDFAVLYDKRQDTIKLKAEAEEARAKKKDRVVDHIISGVGTVLPVLATGIMYAVAFVILSLRGVIEGKDFLTIFFSIIAFYFGSQNAKEIKNDATD